MFQDMVRLNINSAALEQKYILAGWRNIKNFSKKTDKRLDRFIERKVRLPLSESKGPTNARLIITKDWQSRIMEERKEMKYWEVFSDAALNRYIDGKNKEMKILDNILDERLALDKESKMFLDSDDVKIMIMKKPLQRSLWQPSVMLCVWKLTRKWKGIIYR